MLLNPVLLLPPLMRDWRLTSKPDKYVMKSSSSFPPLVSSSKSTLDESASPASTSSSQLSPNRAADDSGSDGVVVLSAVLKAAPVRVVYDVAASRPEVAAVDDAA